MTESQILTVELPPFYQLKGPSGFWVVPEQERCELVYSSVNLGSLRARVEVVDRQALCNFPASSQGDSSPTSGADPVLEFRVPFEPRKNEVVEHRFLLENLLPARRGLVRLNLESNPSSSSLVSQSWLTPLEQRLPQTSSFLVLQTHIGLSSLQSNERAIVYARDLTSGRPLAGTVIEAVGFSQLHQREKPVGRLIDCACSDRFGLSSLAYAPLFWA